jgi:DNA-binding response OmpR family regulator
VITEMSFNLESETRRLALGLASDLTKLVCQSALELVQDALYGGGLSAIQAHGASNGRARPVPNRRVSAAAARSAHVKSNGKLALDPESRLVRVGKQQARLTRTEFEIFVYLAEHLGQWVPSDEIRSNVLGQKVSATNRVDQPLLRVHISNIRRKLGRAADHVVSDRSRGLKLELA